MQQEHLLVEQLRGKNLRLQKQLNQVQEHLIEAQAESGQEQARRKIAEDRALQQVRRAAAVNVEVIKANGALKQQLRLSKAQGDELKIENACLRSVLQVRVEEDRSTIAGLTEQLEAAQLEMQGMHSRQGSPAMLQHSVNLSEGNSRTLSEEDCRGEQNVAELNCAYEVAVSAQPSTAAGSKSDTLLSSNVTQQASCSHEMMASNLTAAQTSLGSIHAPASAMLYCTRAVSIADPMVPEGSAPIGHMPTRSSSPQHDSLQSEADRSQQMQASATLAAVVESSSSMCSPLAPSLAVADSMLSTPKAGISEDCGPAGHHTLPHLPESRHSKGLQQLWNSVAHTPLTVPSPCSMAGKHSKLDRRQCDDQRVLIPEMTTPVERPPQSSTVSSVSGSAASEVTESATAHSAGSRSTPVGGVESPHRSAEGNVPQRRSGRSKPRVAYVEPKLGIKLRQGDAFTFGSAEPIPRSAMRRRSVIPKRKGQPTEPDESRALGNLAKQPLSDINAGIHDTA